MSGSGSNTTIDSALTCPNPDVQSPTPEIFGPFAAVLTKGVYANPQPSYGWRPRLLSLTLVVRNSTGDYDETLAPAWMAAFIPLVLAPKSVGDKNAIDAFPDPELQNPRAHPIFFRDGAPDPDALAQVFLSNGGPGFVPPVDSVGGWWGLLVRASRIPIGGIVTISANWTVERDPSAIAGQDENGYPTGGEE